MTSEDASKLFVAGLPESIDEEVLRGLFQAIGTTVVTVSLPRDRVTGRARGFGFVTLGSPEQAALARRELDGSLQSGRSISVRPFQAEAPRRDSRDRPERTERPEPRGAEQASGGPQGGDRTLYVGNLPYDTSAQEIEKVLGDAGVAGVMRTHLPVQPDGRLRGFGFVTMASADAAQDAVEKLRTAELRGRRLTVNIAHPRSPGGAPGGAPAPSQGGDWSQRRGRVGGDSIQGEGRMSRPDSIAPSAGPADFESSARPLEGRRARTVDAKHKKSKKKEKEKAVAEPSRRVRDRGGAGSWQRWTDWDED